MSNDDLLKTLENAIIMGHLDADDEGFDGTMEGTPGTLELVDKALEEGIEPQKILKIFGTAMEKVGDLFETEEYFLPDMLASAECVGEAMDIIEPKLKAGTSSEKGKFLIATVEGDLHDIGKNIVATMIKGAGFQVMDLGIDVPAADILKAIREFKPDFVGLSALLTTTMIEMEQVVKLIRLEGFSDIKVFIGGAPTSEEFAQKIGADHYCRDVMDAMHKLEQMKAAS
ncbi:cobalamin-dependent protein [Candidatus Contubernalis alkaliaceticus]|uniref:cobalamin-dependent protein n=1 Tax=Candidatus Contubernalis alkaliaceticus TaxID=338645 RepID=UPI001F4C3202|nr:cobalamin-dependent protein [Candidatus Contubernalis alkalaceticus]UNC90742.1 cobalamin B12-binding domain-containing protein [Candidatus Contubernalis alkalaceticus]